MRVRPAIIRADSMRQTASMVRWVAVEVTTPYHTTSALSAQVKRAGNSALYFARGIIWPVHRANFGLAFPTGPVFFVQLHELNRSMYCFFLGVQFKLCVAADDFLGLREWPIDYRDFPVGQDHPGACLGGLQTPAAEHGAGLVRILAHFVDSLHQFSGRKAQIFLVLDDHHEFHNCISFFLYGEPGTRACENRLLIQFPCSTNASNEIAGNRHRRE